MESFGHKMFISSQPVPLMGTGVLYPRMQDFSKDNLNPVPVTDYSKRVRKRVGSGQKLTNLSSSGPKILNSDLSRPRPDQGSNSRIKRL